jgi:hypothetical protein
MATKIITSQELQSGNIELPTSGREADFSVAALADARVLQLQSGQSVDLRGLIEPGASLGWQGPNLVIVSPSGEMVVLQDFLYMVGNAAIMTVQVGSLEPGAPVQTLVLTEHDNKLVWQSTFLSTIAWQEATIRTAPELRTSLAPVAYKTPDEAVFYETTFKGTDSIDMLRLMETAVEPLTNTRRFSSELTEGILGDSGLMSDMSQDSQMLMSPGFRFPVVVDREVSSPLDVNSLPITTEETNQLPTLNMPTSKSMDEDQVLALSGLSVTDPDSVVTVRLQVGYGRLDVQGFTGQSVTGNGTTQVVLLGTAAQINAVLQAVNGLTYTPASDFSGVDVLTMVVADELGQTSSSLPITVNAINDAPIRTSGLLPATIVAELDSANATALSLGLTGLTYGPGGGADEASQILTYTVQTIPTFLKLFKSDGTTQVLAGQVLSVSELQGLQYKTQPGESGTGNITWLVKDNGGGLTDSLPQSLPVVVSAGLVVTQANLEISHIDAAGQIAPDFEWRSGDTLRVTWFDQAFGAYLGDRNEPKFEINRVKVDLTALGSGVFDATESLVHPGVWIFSWTLGADVTDPLTLLSQVKVQAFGTLAGYVNVFESNAVAVNRMVLGVDDSMVLGTKEADVFVMPSVSTSGAVVLGGEGRDVLDYRSVTTALSLDWQSDWITRDNFGLTDSFTAIEEIWFSRKDQTIGIRGITAPDVSWAPIALGDVGTHQIDLDQDGFFDLTVKWSKTTSDTVAEIDRDKDGLGDLTVVYKGLLLTQLEQSGAVVVLI